MAEVLVTYKTPKDTAAFDKYYAETHIPLAKKMPGLRKYQVSKGAVATPAGPSGHSSGRDADLRQHGRGADRIHQRRGTGDGGRRAETSQPAAPTSCSSTPATCRPVMAKHCTHLAGIRDVTPSALGCEECLKTGSVWLHLRICRSCGHVGCCDDSPNKHATKHFHATRHPIIEGYDPPEGWGWCYVDEVMFDLSDRKTPHNGPIPRYY